MNTYKNYLMRIVLLCTLFAQYQTGYASDSTSTSVGTSMVDRFAKWGLLSDFSLGFTAGASLARCTGAATRRKEVSALNIGLGAAAIGFGAWAKSKLNAGAESSWWMPSTESAVNVTIGFGVGTCLVGAYTTAKWWQRDRLAQRVRDVRQENANMQALLDGPQNPARRLGNLRREVNRINEAHQAALAKNPVRVEIDRMVTAVERAKDKRAVLSGLDRQYQLEVAGNNNEERQCAVCFDDKRKGEFASLHCGHDNTCKECMKEQIDAALGGKEIAGIACPHPDCAQREDKALTLNDLRAIYSPNALAMHRGITFEERSDEFKAILERKGQLEFEICLQAMKTQQCPTPNCVFKFEKGDEQQIITCPACNNRICSHCPLIHNEHMTCDQARAAQNPSEADAASEALIKSQAVKCPGCNTPVMRSSGCNHMTCKSQGCKAHFCFSCKKALSAEPYRNGYLECGCPTFPPNHNQQ